MLHEFLSTNRIELIDRCKAKVVLRPARGAVDSTLQHGIPQFLDQLIETLRVEQTSSPMRSRRVSGPAGGASPSLSEIGEAATLHGRELRLQGFTIDQVVHDYGDLCQAITELALERGVSIGIEEFRTLNRCLDNAIAEAVTEYSYARDLIDAKSQEDSNERLGTLVHELRGLLQTTQLAFFVIKSGSVGVNGATADIVSRSLKGLSGLIEGAVLDVRTAAGMPLRNQLLSLADFIADAQMSAALEAEARECIFTVSPVDPTLAIDVDRDLLFGALSNVLTNAFKFTHPGTEVTLDAYAAADRILIDVSDNCGGLPAGSVESMFLPFTQRNNDRSGLGLGLSISRKSVEANHGRLRVRDVPAIGCIFTIDLPRHLLPSPAAILAKAVGPLTAEVETPLGT